MGDARQRSIEPARKSTHSFRAIGIPGAILALAVIGYVLIQLALYPVTIGIKDESTYLSEAFVLRSGTIFADVAQIPLWAGVVRGGHVVPIYPPGQSALLLPAILVDWRLVFAVNVALQLVGFMLFMELLKRFKLRREWALLYLFFPALFLFSRTVMTEIPSATLVLLALLLYFRGGRHRIAAGLLFGVLGFIAYKNLIAFALLFLSAAARDAASVWARKGTRQEFRWREQNAINLLVGFLPIFALLATYNLSVFGQIFGYGSSSFSLRYVLPNLSFYVMDLSILFPLMLFAPLLYRGPWRLELMFLTLGVLLATSAYYYIDNNHGFAENLLTGARLLLPVMPIWLLAYAAVLDRIFRSRRLFTVALAGVAISCTTLCLVVSVAHQQHLRQAAAIRALIYQQTTPQDVLLIDDETAKFISPAWGVRRYMFLESPEVANLLIAGRTPSLAIVYTTQGAIDAPAFSSAQTLAQRVDAQRQLDQTIGAWRVVIWRQAPQSVALVGHSTR